MRIEKLSKRLPPHYLRRYAALLVLDVVKAQKFWDKWAYEPPVPRTKLQEQRERIVRLVEGNKLVRRV